MASKSSKHRKALDFYLLNGRNVTATAAHVGVSRVTINSWRSKGLPASITGGKTWDDYGDLEENREIMRARTSGLQKEMGFIDEARDTLELALKGIKVKIESDDFDAKPSDIPKIIEMWAKLETREADMKNWMNGIMIKIMELAARVMSPDQYAVFGTLLLDLNVQKTEKLDLLEDPGVPQFPSQQSILERDGEYKVPAKEQEEPEYAHFTETS